MLITLIVSQRYFYYYYNVSLWGMRRKTANLLKDVSRRVRPCEIRCGVGTDMRRSVTCQDCYGDMPAVSGRHVNCVMEHHVASAKVTCHQGRAVTCPVTVVSLKDALWGVSAHRGALFHLQSCHVTFFFTFIHFLVFFLCYWESTQSIVKLPRELRGSKS